jgi:5-methylcytosine-specific restriction protein A
MAWPTTSRQSRGYGAQWDKLRKRILARDKHLCQPCRRKGKLTSGTEVDHITGKADGGTDDEANLQAICTPCHRAKSAEESGRPLRQRISVEEWLAEG